MRCLCLTPLARQPLPTPLPDVKDVVGKVLETAGMSGRRASKLDIDDFLGLLEAFNEAGIHFA